GRRLGWPGCSGICSAYDQICSGWLRESRKGPGAAHGNAPAQYGRATPACRRRRCPGHRDLPHSYCFHVKAIRPATFMRRAARYFLIFLLPAVAAIAQKLQPLEPPNNPAVPTVTFDVFWEAATPQSTTISVQANGETRYVSRNPTRAEDKEQRGVPSEDYETRFTMSAGNREKIFSLAEQARYFNGDFDFKKHAVANTGKKTLSYTDSNQHFATTYNWSENAAVDQLTRMFQGISNVIEHGRRIQFLRRFDKLGLEAELKAMEEQAAGHYLNELQVIAPTLESIANDSSVLNIARQRAKRLLAQSAKEEASYVKPER